MNEHTPGPYEISGNSIFRRMSARYAAPLATVEDPTRYGIAGTLAGNTQLFAAAPDLLEACEALIGNATDSYCEWCAQHAPKDDAGYLTGPISHRDGCAYVQACAAVALARGEQAIMDNGE